jgi:hypothetical protein
MHRLRTSAKRLLFRRGKSKTRKSPGSENPGFAEELELSLGDFAALDAAGADAHSPGAAFYLGFHGAKIDAPAPASNVVRMRDVVSELRAFAADLTDLSHGKTPNPEMFVQPRPVEFLPERNTVLPERSGRIDR